MAQRRMFSPSIVDSDAFLDMPISTQALYFHLGMRADDDGFVNPKKVMRTVGASEDDLKVLIGKRFVLPFQSGVVVIKHWRVNNLVRKDWYKETTYVEEKKLMFVKKNGIYTDSTEKGVPLVNESLTVRQRRLGKVNKDIVFLNNNLDKDTDLKPETKPLLKQKELDQKKNLQKKADPLRAEARAIAQMFSDRFGGVCTGRYMMSDLMRLLKMHGVERVREMAEYALTLPEEAYVVQVTNPSHLAAKWAQVQAHQEKSQGVRKKESKLDKLARERGIL